MRKKTAFLFILLTSCSLPAIAQNWDNDEYGYTNIVGELDSSLSGSSSLFYWQGRLWSSNDHGDLKIYSIDTSDGRTMDSMACNLRFADMEEVAQDEEYFYFGDFGNNNRPQRSTVSIYRMAKSDLLQGVCQTDTIFFSFYGYSPDEEGSRGLPTTDFDCEAMIAAGDSLYLFTKQWSAQQTVCYALPKVPGNYVAMPQMRLNVNGLVTGACYYKHGEEGKSVLVLCGYSLMAQPFLYVVYDFEGMNLTQSKREKLIYSYHLGWQTEAIATADGIHYWVTSEHFSRMGMDNPPRLLMLNLWDLLGDYLYPSAVSTMSGLDIVEKIWPTLAPNPTDGIVHLVTEAPDALQELKVEVWDSQGHRLQDVVKGTTIDLRNQAAGIYVVRLTTPDGDVATRKVRKLPAAQRKY